MIILDDVECIRVTVKIKVMCLITGQNGTTWSVRYMLELVKYWQVDFLRTDVSS